MLSKNVFILAGLQESHHLDRQLTDDFLCIIILLYQNQSRLILIISTQLRVSNRNPCNLFSSPLPLSYIERSFYPNKTHTQSECRDYFRAWEVVGLFQIKPIRLDYAIWRFCKIWEASEDKTSRSPLVAGIWRVQVFWVD